jgi:pyrroline-5-carboxylate reductase
MKIGFIGCGNMGGALAKAAVKGVSAANVIIAEKDEARAKAFAAETGVTVVTAEEAIALSDYLFLGVKPQMLAEVLGGLKDAFANRSEGLTIVSMVAGVTAEKVQALTGAKLPVIRIMPNLPVSVGEGMILYATLGVSEEAVNGFLSAMKEAGQFCRLDEKLIDAGTAVSGCGPAFVCLMAEALADGGVQAGLPRDKALLLAEQTLLGTAKLLLETGVQPGALKDAVCSPGGSTIAGVHALEEGAFRATAADGVLAAY